MSDGPDLVVLLDEAAQPIGTAPRLTVHSDQTPLHLAFSFHVLQPDGRTLISRRALNKRTWPGVWSNACCGHPRPGEDSADALVRRVREELGAEAVEVRCVLPGFRYRAVDASGIVENEVCPVYVGQLADPEAVRPDPAEVAEYAWVDWAGLCAAASAAPAVFSPWSVLQLARLGDVLA